MIGSLVRRAWSGKGIGSRTLTGMLSPLSPAYFLGLTVNRARLRRLPRFESGVPVILVGNLTVGGTGKTPLVADIIRRLSNAGRRPAVVSRGYGGSLEGRRAVVSDGREVLLTARDAGDEPFMLARDLVGVPVVIGADRVDAGRYAVERLGADALVLDDGFQQRDRFPGAFAVVALNARDPFGNGRLLPAGPLREPRGALCDAHAFVLTHASAATTGIRDELKRLLSGFAPGAAIAETAHETDGLENPVDGSRLPVSWLSGRRVLALSAIGYPLGFERTLAGAGAIVVSAAAVDHHTWTARDLARAGSAATAAGCVAILTTAKDAVRLGGATLKGLPILVLRLRLEWTAGEAEFRSALLARLNRP
jgi:tetraacyldisaccharide 4'-kinase